MNKILIVLTLFVLVSHACYSQYYFNDIVTTRQTNRQYVLLKNNHIKEVTAKSFEADNSITEDFLLEQEINSTNNSVTTSTSSPASGTSISESYYVNDRISRSVDSSDRVKSTTLYTYDNENLVSISTQTNDAFMNSSSLEVHQWLYMNNKPVKMLLIKDNRDTTVIEFLQDDKGNIEEEQWKKRGTLIQKYYYYYNDQQRLTDIVRFNIKAQRLLPDFVFEYDEKGTLIKLTQIPQASDNYLVWTYIYNANGLKQQEFLFDKQKHPVGHIEYSYQ